MKNVMTRNTMKANMPLECASIKNVTDASQYPHTPKKVTADSTTTWVDHARVPSKAGAKVQKQNASDPPKGHQRPMDQISWTPPVDIIKRPDVHLSTFRCLFCLFPETVVKKAPWTVPDLVSTGPFGAHFLDVVSISRGLEVD